MITKTLIQSATGYANSSLLRCSIIHCALRYHAYFLPIAGNGAIKENDMAYASTDLTLGGETIRRRSALGGAVASLRTTFARYARKRRVYIQPLTALQAYSRRDLLDLGIDPDALHAFARRAAGL